MRDHAPGVTVTREGRGRLKRCSRITNSNNLLISQNNKILILRFAGVVLKKIEKLMNRPADRPDNGEVTLPIKTKTDAL